MIIIPDTHGRTFWKKAVEQAKENEKIIFLGDYVDPYCEIDPYTKNAISTKSALDNFKDIIDYAKEHSNVILLVGNHDTEYFLGTYKCRCDYKNFDCLKKLFLDNINLFKIGYYEVIDNKKYVFSHSCIKKGWLEQFDVNLKSPQEVIDYCNEMLQTNQEQLGKELDAISYVRGGDMRYGSIVWADASEFDDEEWDGCDTYFIFGHTQQRNQPVIEENFALLDCRKAFRLENNRLIIITTEQI